MRRFHLLTPFFVLSGLEDCSRRPKRVLGVGSNRFLPICWHILSHDSSGLSLFISVPSDSYPSERSVHPAVMFGEISQQTLLLGEQNAQMDRDQRELR